MIVRLRQITIMLLLIIATSLMAAKQDNSPTWYLSLNPESTEIIGYGKDKTLEGAKAAARKDIAGQIEVRISSENEFSTIEKNGKVEDKAQILIREQVDVSLESVYSLKEMAVGGLYYVALGFDNSPLVQKIAKRMPHSAGVNDTQNSYLKQTSLIKNLNRTLGGSLDYQLIRSNNRWWLTYQSISYPLGHLDISQLLTAVNTQQIDLKSSHSSPMWENTRFTLHVSGTETGFYTLINVYENGEVFVLEDNKYAYANETWTFPDNHAEYELNAGLIVPGKGTYDMYMAIYSPEQLDMSKFSRSGSTAQLEEYHYKLGELIDLLDDKGLTFETIILHTKVKM